MLVPKIRLKILLTMKSPDLEITGNCMWKVVKLGSNNILNFQIMVCN